MRLCRVGGRGRLPVGGLSRMEELLDGASWGNRAHAGGVVGVGGLYSWTGYLVIQSNVMVSWGFRCKGGKLYGEWGIETDDDKFPLPAKGPLVQIQGPTPSSVRRVLALSSLLPGHLLGQGLPSSS